MASGDILDLFTGRNSTTDVVRVQMQKSATSYQIRSGLLNDAGTWTDTNWFDISNNRTAVEIQYQAFANSGSLTLWLDNVHKQSLTFIDNDVHTLTDSPKCKLHLTNLFFYCCKGRVRLILTK